MLPIKCICSSEKWKKIKWPPWKPSWVSLSFYRGSYLFLPLKTETIKSDSVSRLQLRNNWLYFKQNPKNWDHPTVVHIIHWTRFNGKSWRKKNRLHNWGDILTRSSILESVCLHIFTKIYAFPKACVQQPFVPAPVARAAILRLANMG